MRPLCELSLYLFLSPVFAALPLANLPTPPYKDWTENLNCTCPGIQARDNHTRRTSSARLHAGGDPTPYRMESLEPLQP